MYMSEINKNKNSEMIEFILKLRSPYQYVVHHGLPVHWEVGQPLLLDFIGVSNLAQFVQLSGCLENSPSRFLWRLLSERPSSVKASDSLTSPVMKFIIVYHVMSPGPPPMLVRVTALL